MGTRNIENNGPHPIYVGGKLIAPGDNRDIDERDLPPEHRAPAVAAVEEPVASLDELLGELRAKSVDAIKAQLATLTQEELTRLNELEQVDAQPRKTLLEALGNELIRRADAALKSDDLGTGPIGSVASDPA